MLIFSMNKLIDNCESKIDSFDGLNGRELGPLIVSGYAFPIVFCGFN